VGRPPESKERRRPVVDSDGGGVPSCLPTEISAGSLFQIAGHIRAEEPLVASGTRSPGMKKGSGPPKKAGRQWVVCCTGASGARLARRFLFQVLNTGSIHRIHLVASEAFKLVALREEGVGFDEFLSGLPRRRALSVYPETRLDACIASGSFPVEATVVIPASMSTIGTLAAGAGRNLCHRAAEVALKEGRPLILVPRETPLSLIHLRNLVALKEAGAVVAPFIPAFYQNPASIDDLLDHFIQRLLDHLGLDASISSRWK
jgi:4-hydroxy-3-polyprenylbenzoate decarboxylase